MCAADSLRHRRTGRTSGYMLARRISDEVLMDYKTEQLSSLRPIPIERLAAKWGLEQPVGKKEAGKELLNGLSGSGGITRGLKNPLSDGGTEYREAKTLPLPLQKSRYEMQIFGSGYRARFTMAHELAHVVLHSKFETEERQLPAGICEYVADTAASIILLPDIKLLALFRTSSIEPNITLLESISRMVEVSLTVLTNRLNNASGVNLLSLRDGVMMIDLARSRKRGENLAPRIQISCMPQGWFLPRNKRLSSSGMRLLPSLFHNVDLYKERHILDNLTVWHQHSRSWLNIDVQVAFKCYSTESQMRRMLVIISSPRFRNARLGSSGSKSE